MADYDIVINAKDNTKGPLSKVGGQLDGLSKKAGGLKVALGVAGAALAAFGVVSKIGDTINQFDELAKRARTVGAATQESFKGFQVASKLLAEGGLSAGEADRAFGNLQARLTKGVNGGKAYEKVMQKLGGSILDMNGKLKSTPELFETVGQAVQDGTLDLEDAQKILGERVGPKIVGVFNAMKDSGMSAAEAMADVAANSNIVDLEAAKNAEKFNDTISRMSDQLGQLMTDIITPLLPMLTKLADDILAAMPSIIDSVRSAFKNMKPILSVLGTLFSEVIVPVLGLAWDAFNALSKIIVPIAEVVFPALGAAIKAVIGFINDLIDGLKSAWTAISTFGGIFGETSDLVIAQADAMETEVVTSFKNTTDKAVAEAENMKKQVLKAYKDMSTGMTYHADGGISGFNAEQIKAFNETPFDGIMNIGVGDGTRTPTTTPLVDNGFVGPSDGGRAAAYAMVAQDELNEKILKAHRDMGLMKQHQASLTVKKLADIENNRLINVRNARIDAMADNEALLGNDIAAASAASAELLKIEQNRIKAVRNARIDAMADNEALTMSGYEKAAEDAAANTDKIAGYWKDLSKDMSSSIARGIMDGKGLFNSFGSYLESWADRILNQIIEQMLIQPMINQMGSWLGGIGGGLGQVVGSAATGGGFGSIFSGISSIFSGFFANGGYIPSGKVGIAGEAGAELITGPANVTPLNGEMQSGGGQNVTININAIDTQSGTQFLIDHKREVEGIIHNAYSRRGKQGIYN